MVRLNRSKLSEKQIDDLFWQFAAVVAPSSPKSANAILSELLGKEEKIMVAKRLAAVVLLIEGYSRYKVSSVLKLSQSTVNNLAEKYTLGHFDTVLESLSKSKIDYFAFLKVLDNILHLGGILPHYNGLDRYKCLKYLK